MKHLGDITKINGAEIEIVDVITGGSPCQDLSVAGKRAGLDGERSGLFMEQIRIIKEMRQHDRDNGRSGEFVRPRYMVWENVCGAFSSGKPRGADFQAVLEETAKIVCRKTTPVPIPKDGWPSAGCISGMGDSGLPFSIAWRVHDAQFWGATQFADGRMLFPGTPQRRKRIALVADFNGLTAPEVLFVRQSLPGHLEQSGEERKEAAGSTGTGTAEPGGDFMNPPVAGTLDASYYKGPGERNGVERDIVFGISSYDSNSMKSSNPNSGVYEAETARSLDLNGGSPDCNQGGMAVVCLEGNGYRESHRGDGYKESDVMYTLNTTEHHAIAMNPRPQSMVCSDEIAATLGADDYKEPQMVYEMQHASEVIRETKGGVSPTLQSRMGTGGNNIPLVME